MRNVLPLFIAIVFYAVAGALVVSQSSAQEVIIPELPRLVQDIKTGQREYPIGSPVDITFAVQNRTNQPLTYRFSSSKQFDVWAMRGPREVWRLSKNSVYTQALTQLTLQPGELKMWTVRWNQSNNEGNAVAPCGYNIYAQLTPTGENLQPVKTSVTLGQCTSIAILPVTIEEGIRRFNVLQNQRVSIDATYHGSQPDGNGVNCQPGPPVTRSDWAISDDTGCMYVTGGTLGLDLRGDIGKKVNVVGKLKRTDKGQVYLEFVSGTVK